MSVTAATISGRRVRVGSLASGLCVFGFAGSGLVGSQRITRPVASRILPAGPVLVEHTLNDCTLKGLRDLLVVGIAAGGDDADRARPLKASENYCLTGLGDSVVEDVMVADDCG